MKKSVIITALILGASVLNISASAAEWKYGLGNSKGFNENTYKTIERQTEGKTNNNWRDGSMTGNGEMGLIESCDPFEDVIIFNNTKLVLGTNDIYEVADVSSNLDLIRKTAADRTNPGQWQGWVRTYWSNKYGADNHLSSNTKAYHPAAQLRIKNNAYTGNDRYNRYTNFESGEIGMQWKKDGNEYNSRTFISRPDNVAVTVIEAPNGQSLDLTLSIDNLLEMAIEATSMQSRGVEICPQSKEIIKKDSNGYSLGQIVKYGDFNVKGSASNPDAYGAKGGYATAIRLITDDGAVISESVDEHSITAHQNFNTSDPTQKLAAQITTPKLNITGTNSIMLVSKVDVELDGFNTVDDVESLYDELLKDIDGVVSRRQNGISRDGTTASAEVVNKTEQTKSYMLVTANYEKNTLVSVECATKKLEPGESTVLSVPDGQKAFLWDNELLPYMWTEDNPPALYASLLVPHSEIHGDMFDTTTLTLCKTDEEIADRSLTNTALNEKQRSETAINKAWLERLYDNGRFGLICSSGYNTARLGGIWTGCWMPDWSGDFTQDANVNLQVSAVNTMGLRAAAQSYITYILRQVSDWETNAENIYGIENAIMAGPRTDGDGNGQIYHTLAGYPFMYWNTGADWLLIPVYEYWQCYGNEKIPVGEDVDLDELSGVLELDEADKMRITAEGFDLEKDILAPLMVKLYNFWNGYTDERFYISADGKEVHLNDGTTMGEGDRFMFTPGYSPENVPSADGTGYNGSPSLAANTTMDISAAHDSMSMVKELVARGIISGISEADVNSLQAKFPEYLYSADGVLKEWAVGSYEEHYNHRHVSHTYSAWPAYEAQDDFTLRKGLAAALDMRYTYNTTDNAQAHGHLHNALVEARIKRSAEYKKSLYTLVASNYEYASLMTSHNRGHGSAFCTDNAFGLNGVVTEGLIYSDTGVIEFLPALAEDFNEGSISGLMARTNAVVDNLSWNSSTVSANITSGCDNNQIKIMCGEAWKKVSVNGTEKTASTDANGRKYINVILSENESAELTFTLSEISNGTYYIKTANGYLGVEGYGEGAKTIYSATPELWNVSMNADGSYSIVNTYSGRVLTANGIVRNSDYTWTDISTFTFEKQSDKSAGCVADEIVISTDKDLSQEVKAGSVIDFDVLSYTPGASVSYGVNWEVKAKDSAELTATYFNGKSLTVGSDALGKILVVYATSPDGSCKSNEIEITVADTETVTAKIECEAFEYGFGNYKNEGTAIGTINGKAVLKFNNISMDSLMSVYFKKSNTSPSKTTLYIDLAENESKTYYDDYAKNSGTGEGEKSKRYLISDVTIDESKRISETVSVASGVSDVNIAVASGLIGEHDLYVVIDSNNHTWSGNYDYMELCYAATVFSEKIENEAFDYGFGSYKNEGTNIGSINGKTVLKYSDISFDYLESVHINKSNTDPSKTTLYYDLQESAEKTYASEADKRYNLSDITIDESKKISETISMSNGTAEADILLTSKPSGKHDLYVVIEGNGAFWYGNYDYMNLNYKAIMVSEKIECEEHEYGFGNFKKETAAIGTINGQAIIKYSDISFDGIKTIEFFKSNTNPSKTTLYIDLAENESKTYYDDYARDSGTGKGEASRRYLIGDVTVDEGKRISETILTADGTNTVSLDVNNVSGVHDLYVVIDSNGHTWSGNYDYMNIYRIKAY